MDVGGHWRASLFVVSGMRPNLGSVRIEVVISVPYAPPLALDMAERALHRLFINRFGEDN